MPYIKQERRFELDNTLIPPQNAGELNYLITLMCQSYLEYTDRNYQSMNDIIGALESAKLEFYRRVVAPYEDHKIRENGDVY